jgi:hypothetical protein
MYQVDERDIVVELDDVPQSSVGAPMPLVLADERRAVLAYLIEERLPIWKKSKAQIERSSSEEEIAVVGFDGRLAHVFGPPNDEAFAGHPLASRGLSAYAAFRIENSSWIRQLERMNSVHPQHRPETFWRLQHLIFAFHDSTFECICSSFAIAVVHGFSTADAAPEMMKLLQRERL